MKTQLIASLKSITGSAMAAIVITATSVGVCAQDIKLPPATRMTLPNGIRLVLMENHRVPTLVVNAVFPGGDSTDAPAKSGATSLMASLIRKGTQKRNAQKLAEEIDFLGAALGGGAGEDKVTVSLNLLSRDTDTGLELFADVIRNPSFPEEELERERQLGLNGLESIRENLEAVAGLVLHSTVYADHPYGEQMTIERLKGITRDDIVNAYKRNVAPDHMIIVAVGDFNLNKMAAKLKARFGDWPKSGVVLPKVPAVPSSPKRLILIDKADATQTQVRLFRTGFPRNSRDFFAAEVASSILGGGFTSRLTDEIRVNRSLTYNISSGFEKNLKGGAFEVNTFTKIESTRTIIDATNSVLAKTATTGFTEKELTKVRGFMAGLFAIKVQTPEALASQLGDMAFNNLPDDYLQTYLSKVRSVALSDVNRIAKKYFDPKGLSLVLVTAASKVDKQLKGINGIEIRPVSSVGK